MKALFINFRTVVMALVAVFTLSVAPAFANGGNGKDKKEKNIIPVELKYIGQLNDQPLFELAFSNEEESEFTVIIRDEYGTVLYKDNVKGSSFSKKFLLNTEELGTVSLKFEVYGKKTDKTATFQIDRSSRTVENLVVNKL
jgi:hypothetical protein